MDNNKPMGKFYAWMIFSIGASMSPILVEFMREFIGLSNYMGTITFRADIVFFDIAVCCSGMNEYFTTAYKTPTIRKGARCCAIFNVIVLILSFWFVISMRDLVAFQPQKAKDATIILNATILAILFSFLAIILSGALIVLPIIEEAKQQKNGR